MKMTLLKLFLICTFKDPNLADKLTNLVENLFKKFTPRSSWSSFFPSLVYPKLFLDLRYILHLLLQDMTAFILNVKLYLKSLKCKKSISNVLLFLSILLLKWFLLRSFELIALPCCIIEAPPVYLLFSFGLLCT